MDWKTQICKECRVPMGRGIALVPIHKKFSRGECINVSKLPHVVSSVWKCGSCGYSRTNERLER